MTVNPHQSGMAPESAFRRLMGESPRDIPGDGVQPHSKGEFYPCVLSVVESYSDTGAFRYRAHKLTLDGHSEEYATRDDAELAARILLSDQQARRVWRAVRDAAL